MKYLLVILLLVTFNVEAARLHKEAWYQDKYCEGIKEYVLEDRTRVDCLTETYAIEYDFANKWAEAIGQALFYGVMSGKKPGIFLILEDLEKDKKYVTRLSTALYTLKAKNRPRVWLLVEGKVLK